VKTSVGGIRRSRSRLRLLLFIARRSLFASRLTLILLTLAIAAGAGFQISNTANLTGFSDALLEEGLTRGASDLRVEPRDAPRFADGDAVAAQIRALVGARSTRPVLVFPGAVSRGNQLLATSIYGIDVDNDNPPFHVTSGTSLAHGDHQGVLLGASLAQRLAAKVGDDISVRMLLGAAPPQPREGDPAALTLTVRGIVSGIAGGYRFVYLERSFLAEKAGAPRAASSIVVHLDDHFEATTAAARINASVPDAVAIGWREDDPYLTNYLKSNDTINTISYAMVVAGVSIPIWALFYIHVLKRRREIGILSSLGFGRREIFVIYLLQSLLVAVIGCVVGSLVGCGLIYYFQGHPLFEWASLVVRPLVTVSTFVMPSLVILATALVAGSYPAWRAARTDRAKVLRRID